ncbi:uncharacterized protein LOC126665101 isoform X2 [Mercurialis annua]|nr:uncharacterized protein LOC126665101 isoform X2 [Mercurialis annua]XP_050213762.1 uncharacterized protein LOC126665101 isoform X2 [Mercurialis annua]
MQDLKSPPYGHSSATPRMVVVKEPFKRVEMDFKFQIHSLETEAYSSLLRAFIAQSDLLSWAKEELITELRKELNVTDTEHSQLLTRINSDKSIKRIRKWRNSAHESVSTKVNAPDLATNLVGNAPPKKMKAPCPSLSRSLKYIPQHQPCAATMRSAAQDHFRDNKQHGETATLPPVTLKIVSHNFEAPVINKDITSLQSHTKNSFHTSDADKFKNSSETIVMRPTNAVLHEAKMMACGSKNPNPAQVEKAMLILNEHEKDILRALNKLTKMTDQDDSSKLPPFAHQELQGNRHRMLKNGEFHGQPRRLHGYYGHNQGY